MIYWFNPRPISVLLQPVWYDGPGEEFMLGLLIAQRGIPPHRGEWSLIGGWVEECDESYEDAALREFDEEIKFADPHRHHHLWATLHHSARGDPGQMLAFSVAAKPLPFSLLQHHVPNEETMAVRVMRQHETLCFPSHTEAAHQWLQLTFG